MYKVVYLPLAGLANTGSPQAYHKGGVEGEGLGNEVGSGGLIGKRTKTERVNIVKPYLSLVSLL